MPKNIRRALSSFASLLCLCGVAYADDTAPDQVTAAPTGFGVLVNFWKCASSDAANCWNYFTIYRSKNGSPMSKMTDFLANADKTMETWDDTNAAAGNTFVYQVCKGGDAANSKSCTTSNTLKVVASQPAPPPKKIACVPQWMAPSNISMANLVSAISVKWTNPGKQACDQPTDVTIYRGTAGSGDWTEAAQINVAQNKYVLPASYVDHGPLQPHTPYDYRICLGTPDQIKAQQFNSCARTANYITSWGTAPVLSATRLGANTVKLTLALDNAEYLGAPFVITRSELDTTCGQGSTLGNGLQGCMTHNSQGQPVGVKNSVTLDLASLQTTAAPIGTGPWSITYIDNTAAPNANYAYAAQVTWTGPVVASSDPAFVASEYATMPSGGIKLQGGIKPIKLQGQSPAPPLRAPQLSSVAPGTPAVRLKPVNVGASIVAVQQHPGDAAALFRLGRDYCAARLQKACVNTLYMSLLKARNAHDAQLAAEITSALSAQGIKAE